MKSHSTEPGLLDFRNVLGIRPSVYLQTTRHSLLDRIVQLSIVRGNSSLIVDCFRDKIYVRTRCLAALIQRHDIGRVADKLHCIGCIHLTSPEMPNDIMPTAIQSFTRPKSGQSEFAKRCKRQRTHDLCSDEQMPSNLKTAHRDSSEVEPGTITPRSRVNRST